MLNERGAVHPRAGTSIAERFQGRDNALNLLRLLLAAAVIISHSWPIGGFDGEPTLGGLSLGGFAVGGFFAVSGFLISASARTLPVITFGWRRFLRIFPGYWACLLVTAFVIAPAVAGRDWSVGAGLAYVVPNSPMVLSMTNEIGSTLEAVPFPSWNGSLWTLRYELFCYVAAAVLAALPLRRGSRWLALVLFAATTVASISVTSGPPLVRDLLGLLIFFLAGTVLREFSARIPLNGVAACASTVALGGTFLIGMAPQLAPLPLAYLAMWVSVTLPGRLRAIGARNDLSYGVYLYGFPVGQALVFLGLHRWGPGVLACLTLVGVIPFAALSWLLVERPSLRLKTLRSATRLYKLDNTFRSRRPSGG